jgi:hypothetical protein
VEHAAAQNENSNSSTATDTATLYVDATPSHAVTAFDPDIRSHNECNGDVFANNRFQKVGSDP